MPTVPLPFDAWCEAIGAGIERRILEDGSSGSTVRPNQAAARLRDIREPSGKDGDVNSVRDANLLPRRLLRILRGFNRPYELAQRAVQREQAKRPEVPLRGGIVRQWVARFSRSFGEGWREGIAMYFAPLTALRRRIRRVLRQWRNRRR